MINFETKAEKGLPLAPIILVVLLLFGGAFAGVQWFGRQKAIEDAEKLAAEARDDFTNSNFEKGIEEIDRALSLNEKPAYYETKIDLLMNKSRFHEANLAVERLLALKPGYAPYYAVAGLILYNQEGQTEAALKRYARAAELEPNNMNYQRTKANVLYELGRMTEAMKIYQSVLKRDPNEQESWNQYGNALANSGRYAEALALRREAVARFPGNSYHVLWLGQLYDTMGKKQDAVAMYRHSLELDPMPDSIAANRILALTGKRVDPRLENMATDRLAFEQQGNVMFVTAEINQQRGRFLVDTGASTSVVFAHAAAKYGLKPTSVVVEMQTAGGIRNMPITYGTLRLGKYTLDNTTIALSPDLQKMPGTDGIIGMSALNKFHMEVDHTAHEITLNR